jgi:hypothetical protein
MCAREGKVAIIVEEESRVSATQLLRCTDKQDMREDDAVLDMPSKQTSAKELLLLQSAHAVNESPRSDS